MITDLRPLLETGRRVLAIESAAVAAAGERLDDGFPRAVELLACARGRIIVSGVGKSGLIARKIAATLTSTGSPASFLHPVDGLHGDLGIVGRDDVAVIVSKSGDSDGVGGLLECLQRIGVPVIALTTPGDSLLARSAAVVLNAGVAEEACPHGLAPTSSTTVALALGDALAVALLQVKGFQPDDFAALHPGGALGRRLLVRVADVMLPPGGILAPDDTVREAVIALAHHRGLAMILDGGRLAGVLTAGDLTRLAERGDEFLSVSVRTVMTPAPRTTRRDALGSAAVALMEEHGVMVLPVLDDAGAVVGVVHLHDLLRARVR